MAPVTFVQMRVPARGLELGDATRRPGTSADALVEGVVRPPQVNVFLVRAILHGLGPEEREQLAQRLSARYPGGVQHEGGRLAYDVLPGDVQESLFGTLLAYQASFGPAWMRFEGGRVTLRAEARDCTPDECATRMRTALRLAEVRRQATVVTLDGDALAAWHELRAWRDREDPVPSMLQPAWPTPVGADAGGHRHRGS